MGRFWILFLAAALAACSTPSTASPVAPTPLAPIITDQDAIAISDRLFEALVLEGDFARATADFDDIMKSALPADKLQTTWQALVAQFGVYQDRLEARVLDHVDQYIRVVMTLKFETAALDMRVVVDSTTGLISGLFFAPTQAYTSPEYADADTFEESEVTVGAGEWELPGTLTLPKGAGPFPAVVLVHGSGPNDRDETIGALKPFKDLAWGLASRGVAVLRYDKRTLVYASKLATQAQGITVKEETIDDAVAAAALLKQIDKIDPQHIFVLGHSLGGTLAPRIAAADPDIAGIIILAGATRPLEDLIVEQSEYIAALDGGVSIAERQQLEAIEQAVEQIKALDPSDAARTDSLLGAPPAYWLDLQAYDPVETAGQLVQPMLILQGERDYQVTPQDFAGWQTGLSGRPDVQLETFLDLNHLFVAGEGRSTPDEYQQTGHVAGVVIEEIADWLAAQK